MQNDEPIEQDGGATPAPPPVTASYPRPQGPATDANADPLRFVVPLNPSLWAAASGYLGLASVLVIFAPFAIVTGILGLRDIKANPTKTGKGRAWFGIIMGTIVSGIIIVAVGLSLAQR